MIISSKNIELKTRSNKIDVVLSSKINLNSSTNSKFILKNNNYSKSLSVSNKVKSLNLIPSIKSLDVKAYNFKPLGIFALNPVTNYVAFSQKIIKGNSIFSFALDITKVKDASGNNVDYTQIGIDVFLKNFIYENEYDEKPLFYKNESTYIEKITIIKNFAGKVYMPEWDFNGIGYANNFQGYDIKANDELYLKYEAELFSEVNTISDLNQNYNNGWYTIGTKKTSKIDCVEFFKPMVDENKINIVKNFAGKVYMPQYNFNGIGDLIPGEGYLVKFKNI